MAKHCWLRMDNEPENFTVEPPKRGRPLYHLLRRCPPLETLTFNLLITF